MSTPLIQFIDVHKRFGQTVVLDGVNLSIHRGETTTIIGKSGVGKSVLLKHIIGLLAPDSGRILYDGKSIYDMSRSERHALKSKFSYMFQNMALFDSMNVFDNIALPLREKTAMSENDIRDRVMARIQQLELDEVTGKYPSQLSGGMKKRVAFARALITNPEIVLFDEPTTGLDPLRKNAVFSLIAHNQAKFNYTAVVVSHDIPDVFYISQRVAMLEEGKILFEGPPEEIQSSPIPVVQEFIHSLEALKDDLTGLETKKGAQHRFLDEVSRSGYTHERFSVLVFKFQELEGIAERLGHSTAQKLIQNFAEVLRTVLRPFDISARYSRDEILTVLPATPRDKAETIAQALGKELAGRDLLDGDGDGGEYTISYGVVEAGSESQAEAIVNLAEQNLAVLTRIQTTRKAEEV